MYSGAGISLILQTTFRLDQVQNTDKGIRKVNPPFQNVHIFLVVCSMEHKNRRL